MRIEPVGLEGAYLIRPQIFPDSRGVFLEIFNQPDFEETIGHPLEVAQVNCSSSRRGTVRGLHGVAMPPGQARYATCVRGAIVDIVVDTRIGSPTFGSHIPVRLDDERREALYLAEGLVHGFAPLDDEATVVYLCSSIYTPAASFQINPLDPALSLPWPQHGEPILSDKDRTAPTLRQALDLGILPTYNECLALSEARRLRAGGGSREALR
ncbi:dTDP-4-dehydrorhamnose 3,5-epimerase family protein [Micromonospora sp. LOL_024]|uniref:dTDP-4-dehydrorhamnose 3,5-epimerase family protein n=1 Tax=Micromonospora sp. LOL_024 TaxID=3345412 RepID=UPI003A83A1D6